MSNYYIVAIAMSCVFSIENWAILWNMKTVLAKGGKMSVSHTWDKKCSCISSSYEGRDADLQPKRKPMAQLGRTC